MTRNACTDYVRDVADLGDQDRPTAGGKGASLGELTGAGVPVPAGYVVTTRAFADSLKELDPEDAIRTAVGRLSAYDDAAIEAATAEIRDHLVDARLPDAVRTAVLDAYRALGDDVAVAVRSSATGEDSAEASFAGLQDTYLWIRGDDAVLDCVRRCWASLYSVESVTYRRRLQIAETTTAMAVVVQTMVDPRCSGVMFTCSPATGDRSIVAIEASWGLGSAVVGGEVTPDRYLVSKVTGDVLNRTVSAKRRRHRMHPGGSGVLTETVPLGLQEQECLDRAEIAELVRLARQIEEHYGAQQDIEWSIVDEVGGESRAVILQSRPETIWANRPVEPAAVPKPRAFDHVFEHLSGGARH